MWLDWRTRYLHVCLIVFAFSLAFNITSAVVKLWCEEGRPRGGRHDAWWWITIDDDDPNCYANQQRKNSFIVSRKIDRTTNQQQTFHISTCISFEFELCFVGNVDAWCRHVCTCLPYTMAPWHRATMATRFRSWCRVTNVDFMFIFFSSSFICCCMHLFWFFFICRYVCIYTYCGFGCFGKFFVCCNVFFFTVVWIFAFWYLDLNIKFV